VRGRFSTIARQSVGRRRERKEIGKKGLGQIKHQRRSKWIGIGVPERLSCYDQFVVDVVVQGAAGPVRSIGWRPTPPLQQAGSPRKDDHEQRFEMRKRSGGETLGLA
jgi:hypothetical protein